MGARRRGKGEGSFRKAPNGKWQYVSREGGRALTATGRTQKEAMANYRRKLAGPSRPSSTLTFSQQWEAMEEELKECLSPTNFSQYRRTLSLLGHLGTLPPSAVSSERLTQWAASLNGSPLTIRGHISRVRAVLNRLGHKVTVTLPKPPKKEKATVWGSDLEEFLDWVRGLPDNRRLAIGLLYYSGLRRSEACGLRHEDLDRGGAYLRVAVTETDDAVHVRPVLKTEGSAAWVPLPPELLGWIGRGKGYVLTGGKQPMKPRTLTQLVRRTVKGTRWAHLTPQALRRGFGQAVWEGTGDALLTASMMRHSLAMTEKEYVQVDRGIKKRAHDKVFGKSGAKTGAKGGKK